MKKVFLVFIMVLLTGCGSDTILNTSGHLTEAKKVESLNLDISYKLNTFGINLYKQVYKDNKNIFISPASIYLALAMTYNGANNNTKIQMANVLKADDMSLDDFNYLSRDLQYLILGYDKSKFELANSIWLRDTFQKSMNKDFIDRNKKFYGAMVSSLDFNESSSIDQINNWVKNNTKGRIEKIIDGSAIDPLTVMYLINTIYFKAEWMNPFDKENTIDKNFNNPKETKSIKMMNKTDNLGYVEDNSMQGVLLPYNDNKTSMFVLLPKGKEDIALSNSTLTDLINKMKKNIVSVKLSMPKVKINYGAKLNDPLIKMGMKDAFSNSADFSNMADNAELHISEVIHKSFLAIDEKGTEAAAATSVEMNLSSMPTPKTIMNVDHPFIVGIIDNESNAILFIGRIFDPEK